MTEADFLTMMHRIGLNPCDHDVDALRAAYLRLEDLFGHLDSVAERSQAKALPVFNPKDGL